MHSYSQHGFRFVIVQVFHYDVTPIGDLIEGCVENKARYQMPLEDVRDLGLRYKALADKGFREIVDSSGYLPRCTFTWQQCDPGYCEVDIDVGSHYDDIKRNLPLLDRLVHNIGDYHRHLLTPRSVIMALKERKVRFVRRVPFDRYGYRYCFPRSRNAE